MTAGGGCAGGGAQRAIGGGSVGGGAQRAIGGALRPALAVALAALALSSWPGSSWRGPLLPCAAQDGGPGAPAAVVGWVDSRSVVLDVTGLG